MLVHFYIAWCGGHAIHDTCMATRGQPEGVSLLFLGCQAWGKVLYTLLSHLVSPKVLPV